MGEAALVHAVRNKVEAAYTRSDFLEKRGALMGVLVGNTSLPDRAAIGRT